MSADHAVSVTVSLYRRHPARVVRSSRLWHRAYFWSEPHRWRLRI